MLDDNTLPIEVDIISGFLGAGKTTLIRQLINDGFYAEKLVVLENEFGSINIDGEILKDDGVAVESVIAGCICCSGADTLVKKLNIISQNNEVKHLVVEPTGIARLSDVRRIFQYPTIQNKYCLKKVITVVDPLNYKIWLKVSKDFFYDQIRFSDIIYIGKTENCDSDQLDELINLLSAISPLCRVFTDAKSLIPIWDEDIKKENYQPIYIARSSRNNDFEYLSVECSVGIKQNELLLLLRKLQEGIYGSIYRIKGYFQDETNNRFSINWVGNNYKLIPCTKNEGYATSISIIGNNLNREKLNCEFEQIRINQ